MKKILIVGASSAIAENCARLWAAKGSSLYLVARNRERLDVMISDLSVRGASSVHGSCIDVNEISEHFDLIEAADTAMMGLDIVLIAHGTLPDQVRCQQSVEETLFEIKTNALSTVSLLTHVANKLEYSGKGVIAVISSVAGDRGRSSNYIYGASKALVTVFTSGLRQRLHKSNVAVVTIKPGFIDTPMTSSFEKGFLWAQPASAALAIVKAIDKRCAEVYVPSFWFWIMMIIKIIPTRLFKRLPL